MILTNVHLSMACQQCPEAIGKAIEYLRSHDFQKMEPGEYPIDGSRMFAKVFDATSKSLEDSHPEIHRDHIDVQFWPEGEELFGYVPKPESIQVIEADQDNDLYFIEDVKGEQFIAAKEGDIAVFFPEDVHRPQIRKTDPITYRKVVVKVHTSLL